MSGDIEKCKCDFCREVKQVERTYLRSVKNKECDPIIIRTCFDCGNPLQAYADERNKERDIKLIKFIYEETCQLRETNSEPTDMNVFAKSMLKHFQTLNK